MGQVLSLASSAPLPQRVIFGSAVIRRLIDCAAQMTGIPASEIAGCVRTRDAVWTRWAIIVVAREHGRTYPQIADCLNRDHATIIYGHRRGLKLADKEFARLIAILREEASR